MESLNLNTVLSPFDVEKQKTLLAQVLSSNLPSTSKHSSSPSPAHPSPNSPTLADGEMVHDSQGNAPSFSSEELLSRSKTKTAVQKYFKVGILQVH